MESKYTLINMIAKSPAIVLMKILDLIIPRTLQILQLFQSPWHSQFLYETELIVATWLPCSAQGDEVWSMKKHLWVSDWAEDVHWRRHNALDAVQEPADGS